MPTIPRPEHPRPQFERKDWLNLNGTWTFDFDHGKSGYERGLQQTAGFGREILVPFCPESKLSGVAHTDFIEAMWYHRKIAVPAGWQGRRILLHFGGVDYFCEAFIDGRSAGKHWGGSASFTFDITGLAQPGGEYNLVVAVRDDIRSGAQPGGKQCREYHSRGCYYTRTTGIWQTVWLEAAHMCGLERVQIIPDLDGSRFLVRPAYWSTKRGYSLRTRLMDGDVQVAETTRPAAQEATCELEIPAAKPWSPQHPFLYDLVLDLLDASGRAVDTVRSYAGLRKVHIEDDRIFLNNEPLFQRLVLDQGFYPDGIWTAPSDTALKQDIELSLKAGFNGARLHQKVFEERFHHWADRLGYLTWGESASWGISAWRGWGNWDGMDLNPHEGLMNFLAEWREIVLRDRNHPSIIAWTPYNETRKPQDRLIHFHAHAEAYDLTRSLDPTRPVNDASGYVHIKTDLWTVHQYEQDPQKLHEMLSPDPEGNVWHCNPEDKAVDYAGQPYIVDEFGGIKWTGGQEHNDHRKSWGYGEPPRTEDEFYTRLEGQVRALLSIEHVRGYCYTQLTDVEQEQNGIYRYDRGEKFDMERIASIFGMGPNNTDTKKA